MENSLLRITGKNAGINLEWNTCCQSWPVGKNQHDFDFTFSENVSFLVASVTLEYGRRMDVSLTLSQVLRTTFKTLLDS